jgi:hypothetical protein
VEIRTDKNDCFVEFEFPTRILESIQRPQMYAKLDLFIIRDFSSKYSVALYELLKDYQGI